MTTRTPRPAAMLVGRVMLSFIFLPSGFRKLAGWDETATMMADAGMWAVSFFLVMAVLFEIGGSLSVLTGTYTRIGALALLVFLIPTTLVFHAYWTYEGEMRDMQISHFLKNLSITGGLLLLVAAGPGRYSVDTRLEQRMKRT